MYRVNKAYAMTPYIAYPKHACALHTYVPAPVAKKDRGFANCRIHLIRCTRSERCIINCHQQVSSGINVHVWMRTALHINTGSCAPVMDGGTIKDKTNDSACC